MAEGDRPTRYCGQCGARLQEGDRFCGVCGFAVLPLAPQADQVIPRPVAAAQGVAHGGRRRRRRTLVNGAMISLMALLVVGGVAAFALGDGPGLLGGSDRSSSDPSKAPPAQEPDPAMTEVESPPEETSEPAGEPTTFSSDPAPDPAFDPLIPTLDGLTSAVIALPTDLPEGYERVAIDGQSGADSYTILFLNDEAPTDTVQPFTSAFVRGTLSAAGGGSELPAPVEGASETSSGSVPVDGGLTADYACYNLDSPTSGRPYCTGGYLMPGTEGASYLYQVTLEGESSPPETETEQMLSTMVVLMSQTSGEAAPEDTSLQETLQAEGEAEVQRFVDEYYELVSQEDWEGTYELLDTPSKGSFGLDGWYAAQQERVAETDVQPTGGTVEAISGTGEGLLTATVTLTYSDGTEETTELQIAREEGEYRRHLTDEDVSYLQELL